MEKVRLYGHQHNQMVKRYFIHRVGEFHLGIYFLRRLKGMVFFFFFENIAELQITKNTGAIGKLYL